MIIERNDDLRIDIATISDEYKLYHPGAAQRRRPGLDRDGRDPRRPRHRRAARLLGRVAAAPRPPAWRDRLGHHHLVRPLRRHSPPPPRPGRRRPNEFFLLKQALT